jgi:hypothetical protein
MNTTFSYKCSVTSGGMYEKVRKNHGRVKETNGGSLILGNKKSIFSVG